MDTEIGDIKIELSELVDIRTKLTSVQQDNKIWAKAVSDAWQEGLAYGRQRLNNHKIPPTPVRRAMQHARDLDNIANDAIARINVGVADSVV